MCTGNWGGGGHVENNRNFVLDTSDMLYLRFVLDVQVKLLNKYDKQVCNSRERKGWQGQLVTLSVTGEWERLQEIPESTVVARIEKRPRAGALGHFHKGD